MHIRRAFTLIELLVVIAIIAILAAILFPVFAQAKMAAKAAASVSNEKQTTLAIIMYSNDYDDTAPVDCLWGTNDAYYWFGVQGSQFSPWSYEILPYTKNGNIFEDPQTSAEVVTPGIPSSTYYGYYPEYGYNYTAMSPITSEDSKGWHRTPSTFTSLSRPAETVLITAKNTNEEDVGWYWWGSGTLLVSPYTVEAPDCYDIAPLCMDNWGSGWYESFWLEGNRIAGAWTGFSSLREANNAIASFADGHVKSMQPGNLAAGTNWYTTIADSNLKMLNSSKYLWGNYP